jgi:hypothetical protein
MENAYYNCGDSCILVLKIINDRIKGNLYLCLKYSLNHKIYNLETIEEEDFNEFFSNNKIEGFEFIDEYIGLY